MGSTTANWMSREWVILILSLFLVACQRSAVYAPVADLSTPSSSLKVVSQPKKIATYHAPISKSSSYALIETPKLPTKSAAWVWPANGQILSVFGEGRKGVNIGGKERDPVVAASAGKIVYAGDGLKGYGNLIIIKHDNHYMSVYAYNRSLLVKVGDWVAAGQKIAEMGRNAANKSMLHFEVRKDGKAINPMQIRGIMNS